MIAIILILILTTTTTLGADFCPDLPPTYCYSLECYHYCIDKFAGCSHLCVHVVKQPTEPPGILWTLTPRPTEHQPTPRPTLRPTLRPTPHPTPHPTLRPTPKPTSQPTPNPTNTPTPRPTPVPTHIPTSVPTSSPTKNPITQTIKPYTWVDYDYIHKTGQHCNNPEIRNQIASFCEISLIEDFPTTTTTTNDGMSDIGVFKCYNDGREIYSAAFLPGLEYQSFALEVVAKIGALDTIFAGYIIGIEDTWDNGQGNAINFNEIFGKESGQANKFFASNYFENGWHATDEYWTSVAATDNIELDTFYHIILSQDMYGFVQVFVNGKRYGTKYLADSGPKSDDLAFPSIWICGDYMGNVGIDASIAAWGFYTESFEIEEDATISCLVAGLTECDGIPIVPTLAPTNKPTFSPVVQCEKRVNYWVDGWPAYATGDPHFRTFNGDYHDYMGRTRQQYYYMHPCLTSTKTDMPFSLLGTHYIMGRSSVTGLDYITFELYDGVNNDDLYYVWLSSSIHSFANANTNKSPIYDTNPGHDLVSGREQKIGSRFKVNYIQTEIDRIDFNLTIRDSCTITLHMISQGNIVNGRERMHYLQVDPPQCFRCHTCGLFGDLKRRAIFGERGYLQKCTGSAIIYKSGWNYTNPMAYDLTGWGWEKRYYDRICAHHWDINSNETRRRNLLKNININDEIEIEPDWVYIDPCDANIEQNVINACQVARNEYENDMCCNLIGGGFCDELHEKCNFDVCANAEGNVNVIDEQVNMLFTKPLQLVCSLPDSYLDPSKLIEEAGAPSFNNICNSGDGLNIAFLLDKSGSIDQTEWNILISFVKRIVEYDISPLSYISLFEYSNIINFQQFVDFTNIGNNKQNILNVLENKLYESSGSTYTYDAVNRVMDEFENYRSSCSNGCESRKDLVFVITDGTPTDNVCPNIIERVIQNHIDFVIIGIGVTGTSMDEISCLDIDDNGNDIIVIDGFEESNFVVIEEQVRFKTCNTNSNE